MLSDSLDPHELRRTHARRYFLIGTRWFRQWEVYAKRGGARPGPIDNDPLVQTETDDELVMANHLQERHDYIIVTAAVWARFFNWYGGGPPIQRRAFAERGNLRTVSLDVGGIPVKCKRSSDADAEVLIKVAKWATIGQLTEALARRWNVELGEVRLWDYYQSKCYALLNDTKKTLDEVNITPDQELMLEEMVDGKFPWPDRPEGDWGGNSGSYSSTVEQVNMVTSSYQPEAPGLVGLSNLGNTCFMNSVIQCVSNSPPIRDLLLTEQYKADINEDNPLGHGGKLVESLADLIALMYNNEGDNISPRGFKKAMGDFKSDVRACLSSASGLGPQTPGFRLFPVPSVICSTPPLTVDRCRPRRTPVAPDM